MTAKIALVLATLATVVAYNWFGIDVKYLVYALAIVAALLFGAALDASWRNEE